MNNSQGLKMAWKLLKLQTVTLVFLSVVFTVLYGYCGLLAAGMGGLMAILPPVCSAQLLFRGSLCDSPQVWMCRLLQAELLKWTLSLLGSAIIFYCIKPLPGVMLATWSAALLAYRLLSVGTKAKQIET